MRNSVLRQTNKRKVEYSPSSIAVSMYPGTITFARTVAPVALNEPSAAIARVRAITPAFVDPYTEAPIPPFVACREEILMMHLGVRGASAGLRGLRSARRVKARHAKIVPCRLVRRIWAICSSLARGRSADCEMPAAFTRMSTLSYVRE